LIKSAGEIDRIAVTGELLANVVDEVLAGARHHRARAGG
jgi:hypothetical protein